MGVCTIFAQMSRGGGRGEGRLELMRSLHVHVFYTAPYSYNEWAWLSSLIEVSGGGGRYVT